MSFLELEEEEEVEIVKEKEVGKPLRKPFTVWEIGNGQSYKLKLKTKNVTNLESKFKCSLLVLMQDNAMPLTTMLKIVGEAMEPFEHKVTDKVMLGLFDDYCDCGGSQTGFMTEVLLPLYQVSGFFTVEQAEMMSEAVENT